MARKTKKDKAEDQAIEAIDKLRLMDEYLPAVEEFVRNGGTIDGFLRKSTPVAYARLATMLMDPDSTVAHKAAVELLNRAEGKPVERRQVLYGDVAELNERQLDNEILRTLKKDPNLAGALQQTLHSQNANEKPKQSRKPKVIDLDDD